MTVKLDDNWWTRGVWWFALVVFVLPTLVSVLVIYIQENTP